MARHATPSLPPDDAVASLSRLLELLIGRAILFNEAVAKTLGISAVDLQTFGVVSRHVGPITPTEVAARTGLPASSTTRVLDRLEQSGYVVRSSAPGDRRKVLVVPVESKVKEVAKHYAGKVDQIRRLNAKRSSTEVASVISYLSELATD